MSRRDKIVGAALTASLFVALVVLFGLLMLSIGGPIR